MLYVLWKCHIVSWISIMYDNSHKFAYEYYDRRQTDLYSYARQTDHTLKDIGVPSVIEFCSAGSWIEQAHMLMKHTYLIGN